MIYIITVLNALIVLLAIEMRRAYRRIQDLEDEISSVRAQLSMHDGMIRAIVREHSKKPTDYFKR